MIHSSAFDTQVRERAPQFRYFDLESVAADCAAVLHVQDIVGRKDFVDQADVAVVPGLLVEAFDQCPLSQPGHALGFAAAQHSSRPPPPRPSAPASTASSTGHEQRMHGNPPERPSRPTKPDSPRLTQTKKIRRRSLRRASRATTPAELDLALHGRAALAIDGASPDRGPLSGRDHTPERLRNVKLRAASSARTVRSAATVWLRPPPPSCIRMIAPG